MNEVTKKQIFQLFREVQRSGCAVEISGVRMHPCDTYGREVTANSPLVHAEPLKVRDQVTNTHSANLREDVDFDVRKIARQLQDWLDAKSGGTGWSGVDALRLDHENFLSRKGGSREVRDDPPTDEVEANTSATPTVGVAADDGGSEVVGDTDSSSPTTEDSNLQPSGSAASAEAAGVQVASGFVKLDASSFEPHHGRGQRRHHHGDVIVTFNVTNHLGRDRELFLELAVPERELPAVFQDQSESSDCHVDSSSVGPGPQSPSVSTVEVAADEGCDSEAVGDGDSSSPTTDDVLHELLAMHHAIYTAGAVALRDWIDSHDVSLHGATPSMLSGVAIKTALDALVELRGGQS